MRLFCIFTACAFLLACSYQEQIEQSQKTSTSSSALTRSAGPDRLDPFMREAILLMEEDYREAFRMYNYLRAQDSESPDALLLQSYIDFLLRIQTMMENLLRIGEEYELTDEEREQYRSIRGEWEREARRVFDHLSD